MRKQHSFDGKQTTQWENIDWFLQWTTIPGLTFDLRIVSSFGTRSHQCKHIQPSYSTTTREALVQDWNRPTRHITLEAKHKVIFPYFTAYTSLSLEYRACVRRWYTRSSCFAFTTTQSGVAESHMRIHCVCAAIAGSTILMSCQDGSGCVRGQNQQTRLIIRPLHAPMSYCTCGPSTAPAVTMTTHCRWHPPAPAMEHASTQSTPTGIDTRVQ